MSDFVTLISLWLTPLTIIACAAVVFEFGPSAIKAYRSSHRTNLNWFILGIVIGFVGDFVDNLYWGLAWSADYLDHSYRDRLFNGGVYSNSVFRQGAGILSALCHLMGVAKLSTDSSRFRAVRPILVSGAGVGFVFIMSLVVIRNV